MAEKSLITFILINKPLNFARSVRTESICTGMLKSNVCDILSFSESCIHPLTIVSTYLLDQGDSYSGHTVNFSEASDKAAI